MRLVNKWSSCFSIFGKRPGLTNAEIAFEEGRRKASNSVFSTSLVVVRVLISLRKL